MSLGGNISPGRRYSTVEYEKRCKADSETGSISGEINCLIVCQPGTLTPLVDLLIVEWAVPMSRCHCIPYSPGVRISFDSPSDTDVSDYTIIKMWIRLCQLSFAGLTHQHTVETTSTFDLEKDLDA